MRKFKRYKYLKLVDINVDRIIYRACLTDISITGIGFECIEKLNIGDNVMIHLTGYSFSGTIVRILRSTGTYLYGVKYNAKGIFNKYKISRFIKKIINL